MSRGAPTVHGRAGADDPAAAAGGDARVPRRGRRIGGAVRDPAGRRRAGRRRSGGGHPDLPGGGRAVRARRSRALGPGRDQLRRVDVRTVTRRWRPFGRELRRRDGPDAVLAGHLGSVQGAGARRSGAAERLRRGRRGVQRRELPEGLRRARRLAGRDLRLQPLQRIRAAGPLAGAELLHARPHRPRIPHLDDKLGRGLDDRGQPVQRSTGDGRPGRADHARARTADNRRRDLLHRPNRRVGRQPAQQPRQLRRAVPRNPGLAGDQAERDDARRAAVHDAAARDQPAERAQRDPLQARHRRRPAAVEHAQRLPLPDRPDRMGRPAARPVGLRDRPAHAADRPGQHAQAAARRARPARDSRRPGPGSTRSPGSRSAATTWASTRAPRSAPQSTRRSTASSSKSSPTGTPGSRCCCSSS